MNFVIAFIPNVAYIINKIIKCFEIIRVNWFTNF